MPPVRHICWCAAAFPLYFYRADTGLYILSCVPRRGHVKKEVITIENGKITAVRDNGSSADLVVRINNSNLAAVIMDKQATDVMLQIVDGRTLSLDQRRKIYATLRDISLYTGYTPEETKEVMKHVHITLTGSDYFSLSDCSMDLARSFINTLTDFCLEHGVITSDLLSDRTDDIDVYLHQCLKHGKCAVCGRRGEIHHWDTIGMGNNRKRYDDTSNRKICLCRMHHTIAHQKGVKDFQSDYHVYGIV